MPVPLNAAHDLKRREKLYEMLAGDLEDENSALSRYMKILVVHTVLTALNRQQRLELYRMVDENPKGVNAYVKGLLPDLTKELVRKVLKEKAFHE